MVEALTKEFGPTYYKTLEAKREYAERLRNMHMKKAGLKQHIEIVKAANE